MQQGTKQEKPLYKVLNEQMENGYKISDVELKSFVPDGWDFFRARDYGGGQIGIKYRKEYEEGETKWNEDGFEYKELFVTSKKIAADKYTALAVNNLHLLAEALQTIQNVLESWNSEGKYQNLIEHSKTALSRIS